MFDLDEDIERENILNFEYIYEDDEDSFVENNEMMSKRSTNPAPTNIDTFFTFITRKETYLAQTQK